MSDELCYLGLLCYCNLSDELCYLSDYYVIVMEWWALISKRLLCYCNWVMSFVTLGLLCYCYRSDDLCYLGDYYVIVTWVMSFVTWVITVLLLPEWWELPGLLLCNCYLRSEHCYYLGDQWSVWWAEDKTRYRAGHCPYTCGWHSESEMSYLASHLYLKNIKK